MILRKSVFGNPKRNCYKSVLILYKWVVTFVKKKETEYDAEVQVHDDAEVSPDSSTNVVQDDGSTNNHPPMMERSLPTHKECMLGRMKIEGKLK